MSTVVSGIFAVAILIGAWALLSFIVALIKSGGPVRLLQKWLSAVRGK
jgi:hypothetical protein